ncbi:hypothetical protein BD779DRAFT_1667434 [Infundibulicybe gibba]|nr:hypothetical protein BD779DRAFT_1667434 [Infundibulicybe gibba]
MPRFSLFKSKASSHPSDDNKAAGGSGGSSIQPPPVQPPPTQPPYRQPVRTESSYRDPPPARHDYPYDMMDSPQLLGHVYSQDRYDSKYPDFSGHRRAPTFPQNFHTESANSWSPIPSVHRESPQTENPSSGFHHEGSRHGEVAANPTYSGPERHIHARDSIAINMETHNSGNSSQKNRDLQDHPRPAHEINWKTSTLPRTKPREGGHPSGRLRSYGGSSQTSGDYYEETIEPTIFEYEEWTGGENEYREPALYYYIVPGGMNVIFQDENGNEITRVGDFGSRRDGRQVVSPLVVQDEDGNELYRTGNFNNRASSSWNVGRRYNDRADPHERGRQHRGRSSHSGSQGSDDSNLPSVRSRPHPSGITPLHIPSNAANIILIDDRGQQIPM